MRRFLATSVGCLPLPLWSARLGNRLVGGRSSASSTGAAVDFAGQRQALHPDLYRRLSGEAARGRDPGWRCGFTSGIASTCRVRVTPSPARLRIGHHHLSPGPRPARGSGLRGRVRPPARRLRPPCAGFAKGQAPEHRSQAHLHRRSLGGRFHTHSRWRVSPEDPGAARESRLFLASSRRNIDLRRPHRPRRHPARRRTMLLMNGDHDDVVPIGASKQSVRRPARRTSAANSRGFPSRTTTCPTALDRWSASAQTGFAAASRAPSRPFG